jgi:hypothetical protein
MELVVICTEIEPHEFPIVGDNPLASAVRRVVLERGVPACGIAFWNGAQLIPQYARREPRPDRLERAFALFDRVVVVGPSELSWRFRARFDRLTCAIEEHELATTSIAHLLARYPVYPARPRPLPERGQRLAIVSHWSCAESPHLVEHELDRRVASFDLEAVVAVGDGILVPLDQKDGPIDTTIESALHPFVIRPIRTVRPRLADVVVMGDNGAVEAISRREPGITPRELAYVYAVMGIDLGFALDHIPAPSLPFDERLRRVTLSRELTAAFLREARPYAYRSLVVAHGTAPPEIAANLRELLAMGVRDVAIPLRPIARDDHVAAFMTTYRELLKRFDWVHLLGIRPRRLARLGLTDAYDSFDTSALVTGTMRFEHLFIGDAYGTSLYAPPTEDEILQRRLLDALIGYERRSVDLDDLIDIVIRYWLFATNERGANNLCREHRILRTLKSRFWETCECPACRTAGIAVVLHRTRRHAFARAVHNFWVELAQLRERPCARPAQLYLI